MYKPKYVAVSKMRGSKKPVLAHSNSIAMMTETDPEKGKKKKDVKTGELKTTVELKKKKPTELIEKKSGGLIEVSRAAVDSAKAKSGYFKEMPEFKGSLMKDKGGVYGYKSHESKFTAATNPVDVKKITAKYEYDKKLYEKKKLDKAGTTKRFANPVDRE